MEYRVDTVFWQNMDFAQSTTVYKWEGKKSQTESDKTICSTNMCLIPTVYRHDSRW